MKFYTDIEQSKRLAEILSIESADMYYFLDPTPAGNIYHLNIQAVDVGIKNIPQYDKGDLPCWSLAALLSILSPGIRLTGCNPNNSVWYCEYIVNNNRLYVGKIKDNLVDACYEMIIKLHELNLL